MQDDTSREAYWSTVLESAGNFTLEAELAARTYLTMEWCAGFASDEDAPIYDSWTDRLVEWDIAWEGLDGIAKTSIAWHYNDVVPWSESIGADIVDFFNTAQVSVQRRDPLTLDLDGDGLETVGINLANPILFDHDGDGNKAGKGWIKPDDGIVDVNDANFANLRVWQDLNSDGISQEGELKTLDEAGVISINVESTENSQPLANGNLLADIGTYVRSGGSRSDVGSVSAELGDIDLAENTFISQFTDSIPLTPEAEALPDMNGSGQVRNLREAASLSPTLAVILTQYDVATTRDEQLALLDGLLTEWSQTSELAVIADGAYDGLPTNISVSGFAEGSAGYDEWINKLQILERFNGRTFVSPADGATEVNLNFFAARRNFLDQSYESLRQSVYDGLLLQTRLEPYCVFQTKVATDSSRSLPPIPRESCH
ncbi:MULTISPECIES: hypothetical protein [unclassified Marinobacter]|jgi:hypothetical protein|nr:MULTISPECIES: hypothetical protein [unclassified Marinobacter]MCL1481105.1 hypothetical protein [Marinobacter sp.]MCL1485495.1 hypothetical protein [Marinobacter sp.]MCL1488024.1 hypothetical protein [Marinobacter sp.]UQG56064.1 hypothetical protein MIH16_22210 [Marinobacter sp. M4C]UQG64868.1 hypothetical protein MIH17_22205 [Marinobacter sp. M2C]